MCRLCRTTKSSRFANKFALFFFPSCAARVCKVWSEAFRFRTTHRHTQRFKRHKPGIACRNFVYGIFTHPRDTRSMMKSFRPSGVLGVKTQASTTATCPNIFCGPRPKGIDSMIRGYEIKHPTPRGLGGENASNDSTTTTLDRPQRCLANPTQPVRRP